MPDLTLSEWTVRALQIPPGALKPSPAPHAYVINLRNREIAALQAAQVKGEPLEHTFYRLSAQPGVALPASRIPQ